MPSDELIKVLLSIRRKLRILLVADGLGWLIALATLMSVVFCLLDWWAHFPWFVRAFALLAWICWAAVWGIHRILRPLFASISVEQLAQCLGKLTPNSSDRLASAVGYLRDGGTGSSALWNQVVANAMESIGKVPLSTGLRPRRALAATFGAIVALAFLAILNALTPSTFSIGWQRLIHPLGNAAWPRTVEIEPITRDVVIAYGEDFTAEMKLVRGDEPGLRAFVVWSEPGGGRRRQLMRRDRDEVFRHTLENLRFSRRYSFEAGDDNSFATPFTIQVVRRPETASARFLFRPPSYASTGRESVDSLEDRVATAVVGSRGRLEVVPKDPLPISDVEPEDQHARFDDGRTVCLRPVNPAGELLAGEFVVSRGGEFEIHLRNVHGLRSRIGHRYRLVVREDEPPRVMIADPSSDVELTPRGRLKIVVQAQDDFGITSLQLVAATGGDATREEVADLLGERVEPKDDGGARIEADYFWRLSEGPIPASPGNVIEILAQARDNYDCEGQRHDAVLSSVRRIRIVSLSELAELLRQSLFNSRGHLRRLLAELQQVRRQSEALEWREKPEQPIADVEKATAERLAEQLRRLSRRGRHVSERFEDVQDRAKLNQATRLDVALQATRWGGKLAKLGNEVLEDAAAEMLNAAEAESVRDQQANLQNSIAIQDEAAAALMQLIADLERWHEFADLVRMTRELLDRQETLIRDVARLGRLFGGKAASDLDLPQRRQLDRTLARQAQVKTDTERLLENMKRLATTLQATDAVASDSLNRAVEASNRSMLAEQMDDAAKELRENRINRTRTFQERAAAGLRAMLSALEEKPDRELAELTRGLGDLIVRLTKVIEVQRDLLDRTAADEAHTGEDQRGESLGRRQQSLARTTEELSKGVDTSEFEGIGAQAEILAAASHMKSAADDLNENRFDAAAPHEQEALQALETALDLLQQLKERTEQLIAERSMAAILDLLVDIREQEFGLRKNTTEILNRRTDADKMSRVDGLRLNGMSKQQRSLIEVLREAKDKMLNSVVYQHVCERTEREMERAAQRMSAHQCQEAVARQTVVLRNLDRLIDALEEPPEAKSEQFARAEGGGGGMGTPTMSKPVPTLSELRVLKMMQVDVSDMTRSLDSSLPEPLLRSEEQLGRVEEVGGSQREVHELAVRMIRQAAGSGGS